MIRALGGWASWVAKVTWGRFAPRFTSPATGAMPLHGLDLEAGGGLVALRAGGGAVDLEAGGGLSISLRASGGALVLEAS